MALTKITTNIIADNAITADKIDSSSLNTALSSASGYNNTNWDTAHGWGDHGAVGYLTTVSFADLTGKPTTLSGYGITDAFSGSYTDLSDKPTLFSGSYTDLSDKPTLFSGSYTDLSDKPTIPTVPTTISSFTNDSNYATQTYVNTAVSDLVDNSPETLDTLNELAAALGDDPNFAATVSNNIGTKWTQDNDKISNWDTAYGWGNHASAGYVSSSQFSVTDYNNNSNDWNTAHTYSQVGHLPLSGGSVTGNINIASNYIGYSADYSYKGYVTGGIGTRSELLSNANMLLHTDMDGSGTAEWLSLRAGAGTANELKLVSKTAAQGQNNSALTLNGHIVWNAGNFATGSDTRSFGTLIVGGGSIKSDAEFDFLTTTNNAQTVQMGGLGIGASYSSYPAYTGGVNVQNGYQVGGTTTIDSSRNLVNIGSLTTNTGGIKISRTAESGTIWFGGSVDANHALWNGYYGNNPVTRGGANTGFDGMLWNAFRGLQVRGGLAGQYNCLVIENSSGVVNDHYVKLYQANSEKFRTQSSGVKVTGSMYVSGSTNNGRIYSDSWGLKVGTDAGHIWFGPANTSHAHIYTDRATFYFDKDLLVNNQRVWHAGDNATLNKLAIGSTDFGDGVFSVSGGDMTIDRGKQIRWTNSTGSGEYIYSKSASPYDVTIHSGAHDALQCPNTGFVRINYQGSQKFVTASHGVTISGDIYANSFLYNSDRNKKKNIVSLENGLEKVLQLQGVEYDLKSNDKHSIGFIAQDLEKVLPDLVEGEEGEKVVNYGQVVPVLVEAIKEQQAQINSQNEKIENLTNLVNTLLQK